MTDIFFGTLQYSTDLMVGNQNSDCASTTFKTLIDGHTRAYPWVVARLPFSRSYPMGDAHVVVHCSLTLGRPNLGHCNITLQNIKLGISQSDGLFFSIFPLSQDFDRLMFASKAILSLYIIHSNRKNSPKGQFLFCHSNLASPSV